MRSSSWVREREVFWAGRRNSWFLRVILIPRDMLKNHVCRSWHCCTSKRPWAIEIWCSSQPTFRVFQSCAFLFAVLRKHESVSSEMVDHFCIASPYRIEERSVFLPYERFKTLDSFTLRCLFIMSTQALVWEKWFSPTNKSTIGNSREHFYSLPTHSLVHQDRPWHDEVKCSLFHCHEDRASRQ